MVEVPWQFASEKTKHLLKCWVLPELVQDLILGSSFLRMTQTLTKYVERIESKVVIPRRRLRLQLLGNKSERLWGSFDYKTTAAFPDTGSDAMFVSKEYAEKLDLEIDNDIKSQIEVELGDGTTTWTSGIVRDVSWIVGGMGVRCDFHILDNLCVDVVLSNDYLFEYKIFLKYKKYLVDDDMEEDHSQLCSIHLIGRYGESLDLLEQEYLDDGKQVSPHGLLMMVLDSLTVLNHSECP
jgi:hypothetical protein